MVSHRFPGHGAYGICRDSRMGVHASLGQAGGTCCVWKKTQVIHCRQSVSGGLGALARVVSQSRVPSIRAGAWSMNSGTGSSRLFGQIVLIGAYDDFLTP